MGCALDLLIWVGSSLFGNAVGRDRPWWVGGLASTGCLFGTGIAILLLIGLVSKLGR